MQSKARMSNQKTVSRFLTVAFTFTLAGVAFARQPPALTAAQQDSARAITCEGATARSSAGYRDVAVRVAQTTQASPVQVAGYRGQFVPAARGTTTAVACGPDSPRLSAQR